VSRLVTSGWVPAVLVWLLAAFLARADAHVGGRDILAFTAYVVLCLTLPGTLVWRWLRPAPERPFAESVVLGTLTGYVLELPVYVLCRAVGLPLLTVAWPVLVIVLTLATRRGRGLWRQPQSRRAPAAWSWSMAAVMAFTVVWIARNVWSLSPVTRGSLVAPYVDEPFHLAMIGELRHHFPAQMPYVDGTPLFYHWLTYVHVAASSWITGIEPVVLFKVLTFTAVIGITVLGIATVTNRLTGRLWPGVVVAALLVLVSPVDVFGWTPGASPWAGRRFLSGLLFIGPTQTFAYVPFLLVLLLVVETLQARRVRLPVWGALTLLLVVLAGSKSTFLPTVLAGLFGTLAAGLLLRRRVPRNLLVLSALAVGAFVLAQRVFYGAGTRSLFWSPLAISRDYAVAHPGLVSASGQAPKVVLLVIAASFVLAHAAAGIGAVGLLRNGGWREPVPQFLAGTYAAAIGAALLLDHPGKAQLYFLHAGTLTLLLASGLGLARLAPRGTSRLSWYAAGAAAAAGCGIALLVAAVTTATPPQAAAHAPVAEAIRTLVVPQVVAVVLVAVVGLAAWLLGRRRNLQVSTTLVLVSLVLGLGLARGVVDLRQLVTDDTPAATSAGQPMIAPGGLQAARWLRDHSSPDDLVATNAHCTRGPGRHCERRNFWIAGYTERHVLVEGWAYVAPESVGLPSNDVTNSQRPPFWDEQRLADNDRAFRHPSPAALHRLHASYGVDWLFVDLRYPARLDRLEKGARLVFQDGRYAVLRVRS
jgi:hypothetical protein